MGLEYVILIIVTYVITVNKKRLHQCLFFPLTLSSESTNAEQLPLINQIPSQLSVDQFNPLEEKQ